MKKENKGSEEGKQKTDAPSGCPKYGLQSDMVASEFREPFINRGYRCENMRAFDCMKTMFVPKCNETFNIWTHLLPFLGFFVKFAYVFTQEFSLWDSFYWPLSINAVGIMGFCVTSALAHMFCALSLKARHTCFYTDYAAISIYSVTAWEATFFYGRAVDKIGTKNSYYFRDNVDLSMGICFVLSILSTIQCCATRHIKSPVRHALRVSSFVMPWIFAAGPYIHRMLTCNSELDCQNEAFRKFVTHTLLYVLGAVFMATKFPERMFPGKFDAFGQSHQIMHLCTAFGANIQFDSIKTDMLGRESELRTTVANDGFTDRCIMFTILIILSNLFIAFGFNSILDTVWYRNGIKDATEKHENKNK